MADLAALIYGTAQDVAQNVGKGAPEAAIKGAELAQNAERLQEARAKLQHEKAALEQQKITKLYDFIASANNYKNAGDRNKYLKNAIGFRNMLGMDPSELPDEQIMSLGSDENMGRVFALQTGIERGEISLKEASEIVRDPQKFSEVLPIPPDAIDLGKMNWSEAQKEFLDRQSREKAAALAAQRSEGKGQEIQGRFSASQKTKLADKINSLGLPSLKSSIDELNSMVNVNAWKPGQPIPGVSGAEGALPVNRLKGAANKVRGAAQSIGNQILKLRSGAAVSDGEAIRTLGELGMVPVVGEGGTWTGLTFKGITSEENFVNGMRRAQNIVKSVENTYRNAYSPEVYDSVSPPLKTGVDRKAKAKEYLKLYPNGPGAAAARKALEE